MNNTTYSRIAQSWKFIEESSASASDTLNTKLVQETELSSHDNVFVSFAQADFLKLEAKLIHARAALVIGSHSAVEISALVEGMNREGQLTAVTSSPEDTQRVRQVFDAVQVDASTKLRCVNADAKVFLPRLNAHDYDMLVVIGDAENYRAALHDAHRLLRQGGILLLTDAMALTAEDSRGGVSDAADRSSKAATMREIIKELNEDEKFSTALTSIGTGLLIAIAQ